jgi:hypothetical protein
MKFIKKIKNSLKKGIGGNYEARKPFGINTTYTDEHYMNPVNSQGQENRRGIQVYTMSALRGVTGKDERGNYITSKTEYPLFYLNAFERNEIFRLSSPVLGIVTSRMQRISALPFHIDPIRDTEDLIADEMKEKKQIFDEFGGSLQMDHLMIRANIFSDLRKDLFDLMPDLSNFNASLLRWKNRIKNRQKKECERIEDWLQEPNAGTTWSEFVKKWIYDYHIHATAVIYKQWQNGDFKNFDVLIGGSVHKLKNPYFSGQDGYIQKVDGMQAQILYGNEISYAQYIPTSVKNYSMIPLESLINKISESLFFDDNMMRRADGTRPPEKAIIITNNTDMMGAFDKENGAVEIPLDPSEQKRIEEKINTPVKNGIISFSGNTATVVDLTRAETLETQAKRQKDIREEVALVFNMSNMEINLTNSEGTSGRATSETQTEIDQGKGTGPIITAFEEKITRDIITAKFGYGYKLTLERQKTEREEKEMDLIKLKTSELTVNELREKYDKPTFGDEKYNLPQGEGETIPGENSFNPLFMSGTKD